jgi:hypothetical protein
MCTTSVLERFATVSAGACSCALLAFTCGAPAGWQVLVAGAVGMLITIGVVRHGSRER